MEHAFATIAAITLGRFLLAWIHRAGTRWVARRDQRWLASAQRPVT